MFLAKAAITCKDLQRLRNSGTTSTSLWKIFIREIPQWDYFRIMSSWSFWIWKNNNVSTWLSSYYCEERVRDENTHSLSRSVFLFNNRHANSVILKYVHYSDSLILSCKTKSEGKLRRIVEFQKQTWNVATLNSFWNADCELYCLSVLPIEKLVKKILEL